LLKTCLNWTFTSLFLRFTNRR